MKALNSFFRLLKGREIQFKAVVITALASYVLQLSAILLHWQLWAIALVTILPWIPLLTMKVLWTSTHYGFMAIYLVLMIVQAGHVGEHVFQMGEYVLYRPTIEDFKGTVLRGSDGVVLRDSKNRPLTQPALGNDIQVVEDPPKSGNIKQLVINPGCVGWSWNGPGCANAHGVFGELDRELIHFVWDGVILIATFILWRRYRKNPFMLLAFCAAAIHQVEHIYLFGMDRLAPDLYANGGTWLGINLKNGSAVQAGLLGRNGILGTLTGLDGPINAFLPNRINLHFIYNTLVFLPMLLAFAYQLRRIYDEWLAKSIPQLSEEQLIAATQQSELVKFTPGQIIFKQGDAADRLYIVTRGQVQILRTDKRSGQEIELARISQGQYFGEIGVLGRVERTATAKAVDGVECLAMSREVFKGLLADSAGAYKEVDIVLRRRLVQLGAVKGLAVADSVHADADTVLKTRMIRDRLQLIQGDELSRVLGAAMPNQKLIYGHQPALPIAAPLPYQPTAPGVAVAERPATQGFRRGMLMVRTGTSTGMQFEITSPRLIIGRRSAAAASSEVPTFQIDDGRVSRQHAEIVAQPDGLYLRDLGSQNGTWLNGRGVTGEPLRLSDGAEIRLGTDTILTYRA